MTHEPYGIEMLISDWGGLPTAALRKLVAYARSIGLNLFLDWGNPGFELNLKDIEEMLGPLRG